MWAILSPVLSVIEGALNGNGDGQQATSPYRTEPDLLALLNIPEKTSMILYGPNNEPIVCMQHKRGVGFYQQWVPIPEPEDPEQKAESVVANGMDVLCFDVFEDEPQDEPDVQIYAETPKATVIIPKHIGAPQPQEPINARELVDAVRSAVRDRGRRQFPQQPKQRKATQLWMILKVRPSQVLAWRATLMPVEVGT